MLALAAAYVTSINSGHSLARYRLQKQLLL